MADVETRHKQDGWVIRPAARKREPLPRGKVKIRAPKGSSKPPADLSWFMIVGSTITPLMMGVFFAQSSGNLVFGVFGILVALILPGAQVWKHRQEVRQYKQEEKERAEKYRQYLKDRQEEIVTFGQQQQQILWHEYPTLTELGNRVEQRSSQLWQRLPGDDDFLAVRLGSSDLPISIEIEAPDMEAEDDELLGEAIMIYETYRTVPDLPVLCSLECIGSMGVRGQDSKTTLETVNTLVGHLAAHHNPELLQLVVVSHRPQAAQNWSWLRWLPHAGVLANTAVSGPMSFHPDDDDRVLSPLLDVLVQRLGEGSSSGFTAATAVHYVIIFDQLTSLHHHRLIQTLLQHQPNERQSNLLRAVAIFIDRIPTQVQALLDVQGDTFEYREMLGGSASQKIIHGVPELTSRSRIEKFARAMAPLHPESGGRIGKPTLPRNVRLVELLGATQPTEINLDKLYGQVYDPHQIMAFPIGINLDLKTQTVILREDGRGGHGPHAMLAGTTGKGKSVTLQSIVLSLAATNSPEHLNIVLADFKGGASELARLKQLPHIVGFVTDLDEAYVERFRLSLEGEVRRRKLLLEATPASIGRQIPDIYAYNQAFPHQLLPHLVIVIDEFAKALQINPAFKTTLDKDIAAQGRALGIHLILSTQKAADFATLRPNLEVRMSMQVQSVEDSRTIFNRPEAHSQLTRAGQAYLQVGDNRVFEMFQVAHTHMPYQPDGAAIDLVDDFHIRQISPNGSRHLLYAHQTRQEKPENDQGIRYETEILVDHIRQYCQEHYSPARQICLPPLPEAEGLPLGDLLAAVSVYHRWLEKEDSENQPAQQRRLVVPVGMIDLPAQQMQQPFFIDLNARDGNYLVVGPTGSGKTLFVKTLVMALAVTHTPAEILFYFVGRGPSLSMFEELPHCQAFIHSSESERISRLITFLEREIDQRTELMRQARANHFQMLRQIRQDLALPTLFVVIEEFSNFVADQYDRLQRLVGLAAAARAVDIHFVLTTTALSGVHVKIQQHVQNRLALSPTSPLEVFMQRAEPLPVIRGRGYAQDGQEVCACQIASPHWNRPGDLEEVMARMAAQWHWQNGERPLPLITILPRHISLTDLWQREYRRPSFVEFPTAPIGVDYDLALVTLDFNRLDAYNLIVGPPKSGKTNFLITLALTAGVNARPNQLRIVVLALNNPRSPIRLLRGLPHSANMYGDNPAIAEHILTKLKGELHKQSQIQKELMALAADDTAEITNRLSKHTLILIDDLQQFSRHDKLNQLLDQCMAESSTAHVHLFVADNGNNINQAKQAFSVKYIQAVCRHGSGVVFSTDSSDLNLLQLVGKINAATLKLHGPDIGNGRCFWTFQGQERVVQIGQATNEQASMEEYETAVQKIITDIAQKYPLTLKDEG